MLNSFIIQKSIIGNPRLSSGEILTRPNESKELFNLYLLLTYIYIYIYCEWRKGIVVEFRFVKIPLKINKYTNLFMRGW